MWGYKIGGRGAISNIHFLGLLIGLALLSVLILWGSLAVAGGAGIFLAVILVGLLFVGATFVYTHRWAKTDRLLYRVARQPLIPAAYCAPGTPAQVEGEIEAEEALESPHTHTPCVFYHYVKEKYVQSGKSSHWAVVKNESAHVPFWVKDDSGRVKVSVHNVETDLSRYKLKKDPSLVDFDHSEIDAERLTYHQSFTESKKHWVFTSKTNYRASEYVLTSGTRVFLNGWVYREDGEKVIAEGKDMPLILSRKTKEAYLKDFAKGDNFFYTSNFILLIGFAVLFWVSSMLWRVGLEVLVALSLIVVARLVYSVYNRMVTLKNRCQNAQSQMEIALKKRNDLVPRLEKVVKGYARYEKNLLKEIAELRVALKDDIQEDLAAYAQKEEEMRDVIAVVEKYPRLKSSGVFLDFARRLALVEENIAYFRGFYNKTVLKYNNLAGQFPFLVLARLFGFREMDFLDLPASLRKPVHPRARKRAVLGKGKTGKKKKAAKKKR